MVVSRLQQSALSAYKAETPFAFIDTLRPSASVHESFTFPFNQIKEKSTGKSFYRLSAR